MFQELRLSSLDEFRELEESNFVLNKTEELSFESFEKHSFTSNYKSIGSFLDPMQKWYETNFSEFSDFHDWYIV